MRRKRGLCFLLGHLSAAQVFKTVCMVFPVSCNPFCLRLFLSKSGTKSGLVSCPMDNGRKDWVGNRHQGLSFFPNFIFVSGLWQSYVVVRLLVCALEIETAIRFFLEEYSCS